MARNAPDIAVWGVQYPGRQQRFHEPPAESVSALADEMSGAISQLRLDASLGGIVLVGTSLGGLIALEVALRMEARGAAPLAVVPVGSNAPDASGRLPKRAATGRENLIDYIESMAYDQGFDDPLDGEMLEYLTDVHASDIAMSENHVVTGPGPLNIRVIPVCGERDDVADRHAAMDGWRHWTTQPVVSHPVPGGHLLFMKDAGAKEIWSRIAPIFQTEDPTHDA